MKFNTHIPFLFLCKQHYNKLFIIKSVFMQVKWYI